MPGRVILQDLPQTLPRPYQSRVWNRWLMTSGLRKQSKVRIAEQLTLLQYLLIIHLGARAYYVRNIMHDYPDDKWIQILQQTMVAMAKYSVILVDEMFIPNQGINWLAASLDLTIMSVVSGMEWSGKHWYALLDQAGLKIQGIFTYTNELRDSVIMAVPK